MQNAETVLDVLRERGRKGVPCDELYRQMFNKSLYLLAYGRIYSNQGAMTPGASEETAEAVAVAGRWQLVAPRLACRAVPATGAVAGWLGAVEVPNVRLPAAVEAGQAFARLRRLGAIGVLIPRLPIVLIGGVDVALRLGATRGLQQLKRRKLRRSL